MINLNRRKFIIYSSAKLRTSLLLKACTNNPNSNPTSTPTTAKSGEGLKIAIVLPIIITDKACNQSGYEGVNLAKQKLGVEIAYVGNVAQADRFCTAASQFSKKMKERKGEVIRDDASRIKGGLYECCP